MTLTERKLAAALLKEAAEQYGYHGCNDYDLVENGGLTKVEAREIQRTLVHEGIIEAECAQGTSSLDSVLMSWLARKLQPTATRCNRKACGARKKPRRALSAKTNSKRPMQP